jgi:N utilization substance protein A
MPLAAGTPAEFVPPDKTEGEEAAPATQEIEQASEGTVESTPPAEPATAEITPFDELFAITPAVYEGEDEEEGDLDSQRGKKTKKAKKKRFTEVEFDPDRNVIISRKKHKRGGDWDDNWNV